MKDAIRVILVDPVDDSRLALLRVISGVSELWLAEGFTSYFAPLLTRRAGLTTTRELAQEMGRFLGGSASRDG